MRGHWPDFTVSNLNANFSRGRDSRSPRLSPLTTNLQAEYRRTSPIILLVLDSRVFTLQSLYKERSDEDIHCPCFPFSHRSIYDYPATRSLCG